MREAASWRKVAWLFLWTTLAFWAGCAGENQNYKINEETTPLFEEGYPTEPGNGGVDAGGTLESVEPSLDGLDRSHWPAFVYVPARGLVPHHPHYFDTYGYGYRWRVTDDRPSPLTRDGLPVEVQAERVTAGARDRFTPNHAADLALGIVKPAIDLVTLPVRAIDERPWDIHYSQPWRD